MVASGFHLLLFADGIVLFISSNIELQVTLGKFAADCEVVGMRISTSKSEAMVLRKGWIAHSGSGSVTSPSGGVQVSQGLVHEYGEMEWDID